MMLKCLFSPLLFIDHKSGNLLVASDRECNKATGIQQTTIVAAYEKQKPIAIR
jgi:hypothetical protein